ncbi:MAG: hypothetical protein N2508_04435, partial [Anaerolineae bacterium]|nr:hypothetical protein [Anaerolineae bacterium]
MTRTIPGVKLGVQRSYLCASIRHAIAAFGLLVGMLACPLPVGAVPPTPRFFHLTTANGLSHNIVRAMVQDSRGFLWFGTQDGLNRYDGYTFTVFRHMRSDPRSLVHNTVQTLAVDGQGNLWVGTVGGLDRYDQDTGRFVHYPEIGESVTVVYPAPDGTLWVGTAGAGLFRYDPAADRFTQFGSEATPRPYTGDHILALYQDTAGTLWVGTEYSGLWSNDVGGDREEGDREGGDREEGDREEDDRKGGDREEGDREEDDRKGGDRKGGDRKGRPYGLPHNRVTAVLQDRSGALWVGLGAFYEPAVGGLAALDPSTGRCTLYRQGLRHAHITALLEDRAGTLWVGTEEGLAVLDRTAGRFTTYYHDPLDPYSLVNDRIYALYEDRSGILWVGTDGGVSRYVPDKNRFTLYLSLIHI